MDEINAQLLQHPGPTCIEMHILAEEWQDQTEAKIRALLDFWEQWPRPYAAAYPLLIFVCVKYARTPPRKWFVPRRDRTPDAIIRALEALDVQGYTQLAITHLPPLEDIDRADAERWARLEENEAACDCQLLLSDIRDLYRNTDALPMETLAQHLRDLLCKYRTTQPFP